MKTIFISMIASEERVLGAFQEGVASADHHLIFINDEIKNDPKTNKFKNEIIYKYLSNKYYNILHSSYRNPFKIIEEFNKFRTMHNTIFQENRSKIVLDISTFNRQNLLIMLRLLREVLHYQNIEILYTIPQEVNRVLSKGAAGFSNIPFFNGNFKINKKKLLILLMGYEVDRPLLLWRELEPSRVILCDGDEPTKRSFHQRNIEAIEEINKSGNGEVVKISANDPFKAKNQLTKMFKKCLSSYNIFVSPLNTKLQAVGLYLAWENCPDVQLVIAFPDKFRNWLTKGIKEVKRFKL